MMRLSPEDISRAETIAMVRSGRAQAVLDHIDKLSSEEATIPEWRYIKALAYAYLGTIDSAVSTWEELVAEGFWSEELVTELARAYLALDRPMEAEAIASQWQAEIKGDISTPLAEEWVESLLAQRDADKSRQAIDLASRYLTPKPNARHHAIMRAQVLSGNWQALVQDREDAETALLETAELLQRQGALAEAAATLLHLVSGNCKEITVWTRLARILWQSGEENEAMNLLADAHEAIGESTELLEAIARICLDDRSFELAGGWVSKLEEKLGSDDRLVQTLAADVMLGLGDLQSVQELLDAAPDTDTALDAARVAFYSRINRPDQAIFYQDRLCESKNRSPEVLLASARLASSAGRAEQAVACAEEVLLNVPRSLPASAVLVAHRGKNVDLAHLHRIRNALHGGRMPQKHRSWLSHCLAEYHHAIKDFELAAELYGRCNALAEPAAAEARYSMQDHRNWLHELATAFSGFQPPANGVQVPDEDAAVPVFVVGVPRSGTTLTEQILARHPRVTGMGECQHVSLSLNWLRQPRSAAQKQLPVSSALSRCSSSDIEQLRERFLGLVYPHAESAGVIPGHRFVDKMPDNYSLIGWIFTLFPFARVIYARRDPREIALSCWKANFGAISWAYRIEDIADRIVQHHKIMQLWLQQYGDRIFISDYTELVSQPEQQTRAMLTYLGLDWDPACSDHTRADSVVRTASVNQVRKPVYRSSLEVWRSYEGVLAPAIDVFQANGLI